MGTTIRPELDKKNPYYIPKHRYYELKHYCLQYPDWCKETKRIKMDVLNQIIFSEIKKQYSESTVEKVIERADEYEQKIKIVNDCCIEADATISWYMLNCVTKAMSYDVLQPPCSKNYFYDRYHKFFWLLDQRLR